ncbi:MAG: N-acyl-D-amino-acid deacylase [Clostridia bacterium]|nr:N-acyl-D-amino-acid deacylase [Clostridia bacterium]
MDILIQNARIPGHDALQTVAIEGGVIRDIAPGLEIAAQRVIDAGGKVLIPGLIDSHIHLDKAYIMDRLPNKSGTLMEAIQVTAKLKPTFTKEDVVERATRALFSLVSHGTTHIRTHAEFDPAQGFTGFETVMELKEKYRHLMDIQVVAFPQEGIFKCQGVEAMMTQAMDMGADVVGAIPYNDSPAKEHIDLVFALANKYGKPLDFHQDFKDDADAITIEYICDKTIAEGMQGKVAVGHLTALAALPPAQLEPIMKKMADAQISVMCLPATDLHLGARKDEYNVRRTVTPVRKLRDAGVNMCFATNNIRNAFTPYGTGDLLHIAMLGIPVCHLGGADDLPTVLPMLTTNPAKAIGLTDYGLEKGKKADLVLLDTESVGTCVIDIPERLFVIKNGKVVVETVKEVKMNF